VAGPAVGFIFPNVYYPCADSVPKRVELPLLLTKLFKAHMQAPVETALSVVGISDRMDPIRGSSPADRARVTIGARSCPTRPFLLCDDPRDLDRKSATEIMELIRRAGAKHGKKKKTVLMVTHDPGWSLTVAHTTCTLKRACLLEGCQASAERDVLECGMKFLGCFRQ